MNNLPIITETGTGSAKVKKSLWKTFLISLPMILLTLIMLTGGTPPVEPLNLIPFIITYLFINILFLMMVHTGKTDRYRAVLFITLAVCFIIMFITNLIESRGGMILTRENMLEGETPFCHMVLPMVIFPALLTKTIIFPGSLLKGFASVATMIILWAGASLVLGKAWCSWGCFYGGIEDGFSRIAKKPFLRKINFTWRYIPFAVLLFVVLTSAATLSPTYCSWLCPFKAVTEFEQITSLQILFFTIVFFALFIGLVIILPFLTKRRTQCAFFCPFGAFQSFTNMVNPFEVKIDTSKCTNCRLCATTCPTLSLDEENIKKGKPFLTCSKCGKCIDKCPQKAIFYHIKGTELHNCNSRGRQWTRMLFIYPAFLFMATFSGGMIQTALYRILLLLTTGSMIK